jgi:hypothetical protein
MTNPLDKLHKKARGPIDQTLTPNEKVRSCITGMSKQAMVLTDQRIVVVKPGMMAGVTFGANVTSFSLPTITAVEFSKRFGTSLLVIRAAGAPVVNPTTSSGPASGYELPNVIPINDDKGAASFAQLVNTALFEAHQPQSPQPPQPRFCENCGAPRVDGRCTHCAAS